MRFQVSTNSLGVQPSGVMPVFNVKDATPDLKLHLLYVEVSKYRLTVDPQVGFNTKIVHDFHDLGTMM